MSLIHSSLFERVLQREHIVVLRLTCTGALTYEAAKPMEMSRTQSFALLGIFGVLVVGVGLPLGLVAVMLESSSAGSIRGAVDHGELFLAAAKGLAANNLPELGGIMSPCWNPEVWPTTPRFRHASRHWHRFLTSACGACGRRPTRAIGRGGIEAVHRVTGLAHKTIRAGVADLDDEQLQGTDRVRRPGGGRTAEVVKDPELLDDLRALVEDATRGDPESPLLWVSRSLRNLADALVERGHRTNRTMVGDLLRAMGFSLQANVKTKEGTEHPDRDAQFGYLNTLVKARLEAKQPVISVDTKKKELVGEFKNRRARTMHPQGRPAGRQRARLRHRPGPREPIRRLRPGRRTAPGSPSAPTTTRRAFAVASIRRWWQPVGHAPPGRRGCRSPPTAAAPTATAPGLEDRTAALAAELPSPSPSATCRRARANGTGSSTACSPTSR